MKVRSDKYKQVVQDMQERGTMSFFTPEITPVDMYGKRVNLDKNDPTNMKKTAEDIQDFYGLSTPDSEKGEKPDDDDAVDC